MKQFSARAPMNAQVVEKLFGKREAAIETTRKILAARQQKAAGFRSQGIVVRTESARASGKK